MILCFWTMLKLITNKNSQVQMTQEEKNINAGFLKGFLKARTSEEEYKQLCEIVDGLLSETTLKLGVEAEEMMKKIAELQQWPQLDQQIHDNNMLKRGMPGTMNPDIRWYSTSDGIAISSNITDMSPAERHEEYLKQQRTITEKNFRSQIQNSVKKV